MVKVSYFVSSEPHRSTCDLRKFLFFILLCNTRSNENSCPMEILLSVDGIQNGPKLMMKPILHRLKAAT